MLINHPSNRPSDDHGADEQSISETTDRELVAPHGFMMAMPAANKAIGLA